MLHRRLRISFAGLVALLAGAAILFLPRQAVQASTELYWGTNSIVDGEVITGTRRVYVSLPSDVQWTVRINAWCILLDGELLDGPSYDGDYKAVGGATYPAWINYNSGIVSRPAGDQSSKGCWTAKAEDRSFSFDLVIDTSPWPNGRHSFVIEARTVTGLTFSKSASFTTSNKPPSVEWLTNGPLQIQNAIALKAKITPQTTRIVKACLLRDDTPFAAVDHVDYSGDSDFSGSYAGQGPSGTFGEEPLGCTKFDGFQDNSTPPGLWKPTVLDVTVPTASWREVPNELKLTIFDGIGRSATSSIGFDKEILPQIVIGDSQNLVLRERFEIAMSYAGAGAPSTNVCATLNGAASEALELNGCKSGEAAQAVLDDTKFTIDTTKLDNGSHELQFEVTDKLGRIGSSSLRFQVDNQAPSLALRGVNGGQSLSGWAPIEIASSIPQAMKEPVIKEMCYSVAPLSDCIRSRNVASSDLGRSYSLSFAYNSSCARNGAVKLDAIVTDSSGRVSKEALRFRVENPAVSISRVRIGVKRSNGTKPNVSASLIVSASTGCSYEVSLTQVSDGKRRLVRGLFGKPEGRQLTIRLSRLLPNQHYIALVRIKTANSSANRTLTFST